MPNRAAFARSLLALQGEKRTGALVVTDGTTRLVIALREGTLVFATETTNKLARRLVDMGVLSPELHGLVLAEMPPRVRAIEEPVRFCDLAVRAGYLSPEIAARIIDDDSKKALKRAFLAAAPEWTFEDTSAETRPLIDYVARTRVRIEPVLATAMRELPSAQLGEVVGRLLEGHVLFMAPTAELVARFGLSPGEAAFVDEIAVGQATPRELLVRLTSMEAKAALAALAALAVTRLVRESGMAPSSQRIPAAPPPPRPSGEMMRPQISTKPDVFVPTKPPTPLSGRPPSSVSPLVSSTSPASFAPVKDRPSAPGAARDSRPSDAKVSRAPALSDAEREAQARAALDAALNPIRVGRWAAALPDVERAVALTPSSDKALLFLRWTKAQMRVGEGLSKAERTELARLAAAATKTDPDFAFGFYVVGDLALSDDDVSGAHRLLSKAVKLDPHLADANRLLRIVERRVKSDAPSARGIFGKKLF